MHPRKHERRNPHQSFGLTVVKRDSEGFVHGKLGFEAEFLEFLLQPDPELSLMRKDGGEEAGLGSKRIAAAKDPLLVDMKIWKVCAESFAFNPKIGSRVFYFPEGHGAHSCSCVEDWPIVMTLFKPFYICKILSVDFLADAKTEELFLRLILEHVKGDEIEVQEQHLEEEEDMGIEGVFNKCLTNTDVNTELRLPINASDVFPDHDQDSNFSLKVSVTDFHGIKWYFNHNYQNNNNRYVLSAGWKKFVKEKKLATGDSVVFVKTLAEEIFVGMQRKRKIAADEAAKKTKLKNDEDRPAFNVMMAEGQIHSGEPFEVVFHPGYCDFLVDPKYIEEANRVIWRQGMRVSFVKRDGSSQTGSIAEVCNSSLNDNLSWRMLKMEWDDPEVVDPVAVNPWEVQIIPNGDV